MNEEIQSGRAGGMRDMGGRSGGMSGKMGWIVAIVVIVVLVVLGVLFRDNIFGKKDSDSEVGGKASSGKYQAVFLTNGQVYFGKLAKANSSYAELEDIYYLQVTQPPLQGSQDQTAAQKQQPQLQLVKLGNELHGPEDKMHINADQILFYEDLKDEGRVVQAIKEYQANPTRGQQPTGGQQQAPAQQQPAQQPQAPAQQQPAQPKQ